MKNSLDGLVLKDFFPTLEFFFQDNIHVISRDNLLKQGFCSSQILFFFKNLYHCNS